MTSDPGAPSATAPGPSLNGTGTGTGTTDVSFINSNPFGATQPGPLTSTADGGGLLFPAPTGGPSASPSDAGALSHHHAEEHCGAPHPGSVCCTATSVEKDVTSNACVVTLRASVRLTNERLHVAPSELEELAWLAAREEAAAAVAGLNAASAAGPAGRTERHAAVTALLQNGTIREARRCENDFGHVSYLITLEDKATGRRLRAVFKPRVEGDCEGWHRVSIEVAAYRLNLLLGMDLVPPAVWRPAADVDWTHYPAGGALMYWCGNTRQLSTVPMAAWGVPPPVLLSDTRILDVLLQNSDRHAGHFLFAEHWADGEYADPSAAASSTATSSSASQQQQQQQGNHQCQGHHQHQYPQEKQKPPPPPQQQQQQQQQPCRCSGPGQVSGSGSGGSGGGGDTGWRGRLSPVLIDHAAGFRHDAFVCLDHENAFCTGPTRVISARTYLRLRFLDAPSLRSALGGLGLSEEELAGLLARRDAILALFDGLVATKGYDKVVLEAW